MKINFRFLVLIGLLIPFILISCKTTDDGMATGLIDPSRIGDIAPEDIPGYARELQNTVATAREEALQAGAQDLVPDRFALVDEMADSSAQYLESGNYADSIMEGREAVERYGILQTLAEARENQRAADEQDFFTRDPEIYIEAAEAGNFAVDYFDDDNLEEARIYADQALAGFILVNNNGWHLVSDERAIVASDWRDAAQEVRANVAMRSEFTAAEQAYADAQTAMETEDYAQAAQLFEQSGMLFMTAHDNTLISRQRAEEAMRLAEERLAESEERAHYVDGLIGGGE